MADRQCPNCGNEVFRTTVNCPQCGARVMEARGPLVFLGIVVLVVVGLMAQDKMDRENSWLREPLKRVRQKRQSRRSAHATAAARSAEPISRRESAPVGSRPRVVEMKREEVAIMPGKPEPRGEKVMTGITKDLRIGARVTVVLKSGDKLQGILQQVTQHTLDLQTDTARMTLSKHQLSTDSRIEFFDPDYAKHKGPQSGRFHVVAGPISADPPTSGTNLLMQPKTDMGDVFMKAFD